MDSKLIELHMALGDVVGERKTCGKKLKYRSEGTAGKAAAFLNLKCPGTLSPYPCCFCGGWHIGVTRSIENIKNIIGRKYKGKDDIEFTEIVNEEDYDIDTAKKVINNLLEIIELLINR